MDRLPGNFVDKLSFLGDNRVEIKLVPLILSLRTASMTTEVPTDKADTAAKEGD
jgi:hypothetical protein